MKDQLLVLGLLKLQDMHGYQLGDFIDKRLGYLTALKKPTMYHLLGKMETDGFVSKTVSREGNRPERFTYRLTPAGEERFYELLNANLQDTHSTYFEDDIGLLFLSEIPAGAARTYLGEKRLRVQERIGMMQHAVAQHTSGTPAYYTLRHHLIHLETERAWLDELLGDLKKRAVKQDILECLETAERETPAPTAKPKHNKVKG